MLNIYIFCLKIIFFIEFSVFFIVYFINNVIINKINYKKILMSKNGNFKI